MNPLVIVSGLGRSGTSMMMRILKFGGVPCCYGPDGETPKSFNKYGIYEGGEVPEEGNVAVKSVYTFPRRDGLDVKFDCYFIFMNRPSNEIVASRRFLPPPSEKSYGRKLRHFALRPQNADFFKQQQDVTLAYIADKKHIIINYKDIVFNPRPYLEQIKAFIPFPFNVDEAEKAIDKSIYVDRSNQ